MNAVLKLEFPAFGLVLSCSGPFAGSWEVFKWGQWITTLRKLQQLPQKQSVNKGGVVCLRDAWVLENG